MTKHFGALDLYRFIAAFGVAALHFSQLAKYETDRGFGFAVGHFPLFVDFFFILSGFVIGLTYSDSVSTTGAILIFLRRRIARIYPLYLLTLLIFMTPAMFGMSRNPEKWKFASIAQDMLLVKSWPISSQLPFNFPAWSISVEWAMYLAFPLIMLFYRRVGIWALVFLIAAGFAGIEYVIYAKLTDLPTWFGNISPIRALPTFAAGILIALTYRAVTIPHSLWLGCFAFLLAAVAMMVHLSNYIVIALFFACTFLTANAYAKVEKTIFDSPIFMTLGNASYSLYMLHAIFLTVSIDFLWSRLSTSSPPLWYGALVAAALFLFSIASYRIFERPARNFISGRKR